MYFCNAGEINCLEKVLNTNPDFVAFSSSTTEHTFAINFANDIKQKNRKIKIMMGGPHPTFFPEVLNENSVDMIGIGESDEAIVELLDKFEQKQHIHDIQKFLCQI